MKFKKYINEIKIQKTGEFKTDEHLKMLDKFQKDIKKLTKLYKALDKEDSPKAIKDAKTLRKAVNIFSNNFEKWVYGVKDQEH